MREENKARVFHEPFFDKYNRNCNMDSRLVQGDLDSFQQSKAAVLFTYIKHFAFSQSFSLSCSCRFPSLSTFFMIYAEASLDLALACYRRQGRALPASLTRVLEELCSTSCAMLIKVLVCGLHRLHGLKYYHWFTKEFEESALLTPLSKQSIPSKIYTDLYLFIY